MNIKARTLIIVFITISVVISISNDLASISAVLGLISFIMICHFYLGRHQEDISTILKDYSDNLVTKMNIVTQPVERIEEPDIPHINQTNIDTPKITLTPQQQVDNVLNIQSRIPQFPGRKNLTYLYENNRINQLLQRQKPLKDVKSHTKMIHNQAYFHNLFDDEIRYNLQRAGFYDGENISDDKVCM